MPITRSDPVTVEANLLVQGPARRLDDTALNLISESVRVNDLTCIGDCEGARNLDYATRSINFDLCDHRNENRKVLILGKTNTAAPTSVSGLAVLPVGIPSDRFDHRTRT